ncbi:MAG: DUF4271 domain-containing protein [Chitinophagales bacterium]|nr:DUF4271 domain-containing protein [Chitinophagales bacterium]
MFAQADTATIDTIKIHKRKVNDSPTIIKPIIKPKPQVDSSTILINTDSIILIDTSITENKDSITNVVIPVSINTKDTSTFAAIIHHKYFPLENNKVFMITKWQNLPNKDILFYSLLILVGFLAIIKLSFTKYFSNIFKQIFQYSHKQRQTQEQIIQNNFPSLLMNFLFVLSGGMFIALLAYNRHWVNTNFWLLLLYSCILLASIYLLKFVFLSFFGWVFNAKDTTDNYTFIVFLINKIIGVILIPITIIIAFATSKIVDASISITFLLLIIIFIYRYWLSYKAIRNTIKVSSLRFFLYLCAVEILPLTILYKAVFNFIQG